jgi:hypothetical protein
MPGPQADKAAAWRDAVNRGNPIGGNRKPGTLTPVPNRMVRVCCAANANAAQQLVRII